MQRQMESMCALPWNDRPLEPFPFFTARGPFLASTAQLPFFLTKNVFFDCAVRNEYWLIAFSLSFYSIRFDSICHHHLILFPFNIYRGQCFRFGCYFILFIIWHQYEFRITSTHSALNAKRFRYNMFRYERYCCAFH